MSGQPETVRGAGFGLVVLSVFVVAVVLNYAWEMAQAVLHEPMGSIVEASWGCFVASLGDGVIVLAIFAAGALRYRRVLWFARWSAGSVAFAVLLGAVIGAPWSGGG